MPTNKPAPNQATPNQATPNQAPSRQLASNRRLAERTALNKPPARQSTSRWYWAAAPLLVAASVTAALWGIQERFDWLVLWHNNDAAAELAVEPDETPQQEKGRPDAPPALEVVEQTMSAAVAAATQTATDPTVTFGASVGVTGPGVCNAATPEAFTSSAAKIVAADADTTAVTVAAVGPGLGAEAVRNIRSSVRGCSGVRINSSTAGVGDGFTAAGDGTLTTVLRRGDVVVSVLSVGAATSDDVYGNTPDTTRHQHIVAAADAELNNALHGVCAATGDVPDGPARNPYSGAEFTGLIVTRTVTPADLPPPDTTTTTTTTTTTAAPASGPSTTTPGAASAGSDAPTTTVASIVDEMDAWETSARAATALEDLTEPPTPRPRWRRAPKPPDPAPETRTFEVRIDDPTGPGCGWGFTATAAPQVDSTELDRAAETAQYLAAAALAADREQADRAAQKHEAELAEYAIYTQRRHVWQLYDRLRDRLTPPPPTTTTTTTTTQPPANTTTTVAPTTTTTTSTTTTSTTQPPPVTEHPPATGPG